MTSIHLERREPARNRMRFYAIIVTRTLFGSWAMVREWGRIGQPGTVRETEFATEAEAWAAGERWRMRKEKRGYMSLADNRGITFGGLPAHVGRHAWPSLAILNVRFPASCCRITPPLESDAETIESLVSLSYPAI